MKPLTLLIALVATASTGCRQAVQATTGPTEVTLTTRVFSGTLDVGGTRFFSFTVSEGGTVSAMLASVTSPQTGVALPTIVSIGIGAPRGTGCDAATRTNATAALIAQLSHSVTPGVYCIDVSDSGHLSRAVNFAVRFVHP